MADENQVVDAALEDAPVQVEEATETTAEVVEEVVEVETSVASLFEGEDLSEEFKNKMSIVFEAAVNEAVDAKVATLSEELTEKLNAEMAESLEEQVETIVENLDKYLDYVVEQWMEDNEIAVETGIKVEMAESFMEGLKTLFEEHNVEINEETHDVVSTLEEEISELKTTSNELVNANIELQSKINDFHADKALDTVVEGLTDIEIERFKVLSNNLDKKDLEVYSDNLKTIKESFFAEAPAQKEVHGDEESEIILEEDVAIVAPASEYGSVNALVEALNARKNK
jgi:Mg/Co/Ni transporter MgtE